MDFACGNVRALAGSVSGAMSVYSQRHFPAKDHMSSFGGMGVIGIVRMGAILPNVGMAKTLTMELIFYCSDIHAVPLATGYQQFATCQRIRPRLPKRRFAVSELRLGTSLGGEI